MKETRLGRVDSEIQTALSNIFTYEISSPELKGTMVSIVACKTTNDLRHCRVLISIYPDKDKDKKFFAVKETIPFVRRQLAQKINLRVVPELQFELDNSAEYGAKIDKIIEDLHNDRKD